MEIEQPNRYTVLVTDDESDIRNMMADYLSVGAYVVLTAASAREALELLNQNHVDVVIADEKMPGMTGSELLSVIRKEYPDTIRMMLTGNPTFEMSANAMKEGGIYRLFTKPCNMMDLKITIEQALKQRELEKENRRLADLLRRQRADYAILEQQCPGITDVKRDEDGVIIIDEE